MQKIQAPAASIKKYTGFYLFSPLLNAFLKYFHSKYSSALLVALYLNTMLNLKLKTSSKADPL